MNIVKYKEVISSCRFCFMCRHLATVGNVTFKESDTPRGRALIADMASKKKEVLREPDFVETFYRETLSAACKKHCVSSYDEAGLARAMREDIVDAGLEPERVRTLAKTIEKTGNPFGLAKDALDCKGARETAPLLYYIDAYTLHKSPEVAVAFMAILKKAGIAFSVLKEKESSGKALFALGYRKEAGKAALKTAKAIKKSGCKVVVTSCPASFDAFKNDYPELGASLGGIQVKHSSQLILELIKSKKLKSVGKVKKASYIDSDYLKNYNDVIAEPREALAAAGYQLVEFGSNQEESYSLGEGAVVYDLLSPEILVKLEDRVLSKLDKKTVLITASPYTKQAFKNGVLSIEEAVAERVL